MGLKWFRARIKMGKPAKQPSGVAGFYRTISQFDGGGTWPPAPKIVPRPRVIPVPPPQVSTLPTSRNPMASLGKNETVEKMISDGEQIEIEQLEEDTDYEMPRINLPRESVELMRSGILENDSPRQKVNKMKKSEMRKKGRAPLPRSMLNSSNDYLKLDNVGNSRENELEI